MVSIPGLPLDSLIASFGVPWVPAVALASQSPSAAMLLTALPSVCTTNVVGAAEAGPAAAIVSAPARRTMAPTNEDTRRVADGRAVLAGSRDMAFPKIRSGPSELVR